MLFSCLGVKPNPSIAAANATQSGDTTSLVDENETRESILATLTHRQSEDNRITTLAVALGSPFWD